MLFTNNNAILPYYQVRKVHGAGDELESSSCAKGERHKSSPDPQSDSSNSPASSQTNSVDTIVNTAWPCGGTCTSNDNIMHSCIKTDPETGLIDQVQLYGGGSNDILNPMYDQHYQSTVAAAHQYYSSMQQQYGATSSYMSQSSPLAFYPGAGGGSTFNKSSSYYPIHSAPSSSSYQSSSQTSLQYQNSYSSVAYNAAATQAAFSSAQSSPSDFNGYVHYAPDSPQYNYFTATQPYSPYSSSSSSATTYPIAQFLPESPNGLFSGDNTSSSSLKLDSLPSSKKVLCNDLKATGSAIKGRGRKQNVKVPSVSPEITTERVFIWDLDETLIIFQSLINGSFANKYRKDTEKVMRMGFRMEELVFQMADNNFFYSEIDDCDQVQVDDLSTDDNGQDLTTYNFSSDGFQMATTANAATNGVNLCMSSSVRGGVDWMRKLAFRYRKIKELYTANRNSPSNLVYVDRREEWLKIRKDIEVITENWLSLNTKCLSIIASRSNCVNILVTTTQLVPALSKLLLFGLATYFPIENVYSASKVGKDGCFERITTRFGRTSTFVVIGDGHEEETAAKAHNFPFWRISSHTDIVALFNALNMGFL